MRLRSTHDQLCAQPNPTAVRAWRAWLLLSAWLCACTSLPASGDQHRDAGESPQSCTPGISCSGRTAAVCTDHGELVPIDCNESGLQCADGLGCVICMPAHRACDGDVPRVCRADGSGWDTEAACDAQAGLHCSRETGTCSDLCAAAEASATYIGCEYWPTVTANPLLSEEFSFAVAVSNPQSVPAHVTVDRAGDATRVVAGPITIAPDTLEVIKLPWSDALRGTVGSTMAPWFGSQLAPAAAYRLTSDVPVSVYQFNALEYEIGHDCAIENGNQPKDGRCFSYTNDASLLVPSHVLTGDYMITARESQLQYETSLAPNGAVSVEKDGTPMRDIGAGMPGFLSVVAVDESVSVELTFSAYTAAGAKSGVVGAYVPGQRQQFSLRRGDVLQILSGSRDALPSCAGSDDSVVRQDGSERRVHYCAPDRDYDLTGTRVHADGRVAVLAGHTCALVPFDRFACDHLEESMFPMETWGHEFVVATTKQLLSEPNLVRIVAAQDATSVSFEPAVHASVTLDAGEFVEFEVVEDFVVHGGGPLTVGQFLVGQDYAGLGTSLPDAVGDPAFALVAPADQYRKRYDFLAPETYTENWISVVASAGDAVELDGELIAGWQPIGRTGKQAIRIAVPAGAHHIESQGRFGVTVYGFGAYTSYMYSAGLDFQKIVYVL